MKSAAARLYHWFHEHPGRPMATAAAVLLALAPRLSWAAGSGVQSTNIPWYLSRATGLVAYLLLFCTVALGLMVRTKALDGLVARWRVTDLHTVLSILVIVFVAVHAGVLLGDTYVGFSVVEILVPFASPYLPVWTGLGIIMAYLLLIVALSFPARRLIGYRAWRSLHYLTFFIYIGALVHGLFTGTDTARVWAQAIYLSTATVVLGFVLYRVLSWRRRELALLLLRPARAAAAIAERRAAVETRSAALLLAGICTAAVLVAAAGFGPFHWGRQATSGTVAADGQPQPAAGVPAALIPAPTAPPAGFSEHYTGSVLQNGGQRGTVALRLEGSGGQPVQMDLQVVPGRGGAAQGTATLSDLSGATLCSGTLTSFTNSGFVVDCAGSGPYAGLHLAVQGSIQGGGDSFSGDLNVSIDRDGAVD